MKIVKVFISFFLTSAALSAGAQVESAGGVRKKSEKENKEKVSITGVTDRMKNSIGSSETHDADLSYMKEIYRNLDLSNVSNATLYYPEDVVEGQENLFRIIFGLVVDGKIPAYEYLDGREIFTNQYKVNIPDMLERFNIYAQPAKGYSEKNPKFIIEEADVPSGQVLNYYIIEKWEFDRRSNAMKTNVEAICPVLNSYGDYGNATKYPMFWVKYEDLRPYLTQQFVFVGDDNNLPQYSLADFFTLGLYDGEIYKTRNLRNLSLSQMYPDEDDLKRAQDSIDNHLRNYGKDLWVPTREEYLAQKEAEEKNLKENEETVVSVDEAKEKKITSSTSSSSRAKKKKSKKVKSVPSSSSSTAEKSVKRRKR